MDILFSKVNVRPILKKEEEKWVRLMKQHHYLGFSGNLGEQINYVAEIDGNWLALLGWSCAALKINDRDKWIGWSVDDKLKKLSYIANNSRFLISPKIKVKNLASHILSKNLKRLSQDWFNKYNHPILMVETFVDSNQYKGTCYIAENWINVGSTKGYRKKQKAYIYHGQKKIILLKPIVKNARRILGSPFTNKLFLPVTVRGRQIVDVNSINLFGKNGLINFCTTIQDGRDKRGLRHHFEGIMSLCILAILSGARGYKGIYLWGNSLSKDTLWKLKLRKAPCESAIRRFILSLDASDVDQKLTKWLLKHESLNGIPLAIDGKTLKGSKDGDRKGIQLLSMVSHDSSLVFAQEKVDSKTNEIPVAQNLLEKTNIKGSVITADALHSQDKTAAIIVRDKDADYVFSIKDNRSSVKEEIKTALSNSAFPPSKVSNS